MKRFSVLLALVSAVALLSAADVHAQAAATPAPLAVYTVGEGETVMTIAKKLRYPKATEGQMAYAIVKSNPNAFAARSKERLQAGAKLVIPAEATVLAYKPEVADREAAKLRNGDTRYQDGVAAEKAGDMKGAVKAYIESARLGHPLADLRLGQLYDKDLSKTLPRDLQQSISHYQKAREFGIEIKGPTDRAPQVTKTIN